MKKKIWAMTIAVCFALGVAGCANRAESNGPASETAVESTSVKSEEATGPAKASESAAVKSEASAQNKETADTEVTSENRKEEADMQTTDFDIGGVKFRMVLVEHGSFTMGSDNMNVAFSESPAHPVTLTEDYLIGETEVTEALWNAVTGGKGGSSDLPKTSVTWRQASDFTDQLTQAAREQGLIDSSVRFALPTEAQWEFAAKGGNLSKGYLYSGSNNIDDVAVTRENSGSDSPIQVKTKQPNELGIYDMSGNASEWVEAAAEDYSADAQTDPVSHPDGIYVKRGGSNYHSFSSEPYLFTTTGRYFYSSTDWTIGFRLALIYEQ